MTDGDEIFKTIAEKVISLVLSGLFRTQRHRKRRKTTTRTGGHVNVRALEHVGSARDATTEETKLGTLITRERLLRSTVNSYITTMRYVPHAS